MTVEESAPPKGGQFGGAFMRMSTDLVLHAGQSFRGAARAMAVLARHGVLESATPCADTIQMWLLRLGCSLLHSPLPIAEDWAFLVDLTMTVGSRKVLVIAGCRLSQMPFGQRDLAPSDLHLVRLAVLERSTHETILPELRAAIARTGTPRVITADEGSDVTKAVRRLIEEQPTIASTLDVAHAGANLLKKRWAADPRWSEFLQKLAQTNQRIRQTELACLRSPRQRDKGRFMSVGVLPRFAARVLYWLDGGLADANGAEKYGWLGEYRSDLQRWRWEQQAVQRTIGEVRRNGWETVTLELLETEWRQMPAAHTNAGLIGDLRAFAAKMAGRAEPDETLPGSTEALESSFGSWKQWTEAGSNAGLSRLVLAMGSAMKPMPSEDYQQAMEAAPLKKVWNWLARNIGATAQKLRTCFNQQTAPAVEQPKPEEAATTSTQTFWQPRHSLTYADHETARACACGEGQKKSPQGSLAGFFVRC